MEIRRRLAQDNPARFASDLAVSLNTLSKRLSDAGDGAGALAAIREAVNTYRRLAQDNPARFAPDLALEFRGESRNPSTRCSCRREMDPGFRGCQQILRTAKFVVPAKAGTQEQATEIPGFPLARE